MWDIVLVITGVVVFLLILVTPVAIGSWLLMPLDHAARNRKSAIRFTLLDFLGLFLIVQIPMALVHGFLTARDGTIIWVLDILGWVFSLLIWVKGVATFSQAGIADARARGILVFLVLPMAFYGSFAIAILPIALLSSGFSFPRLIALLVIEAILISGLILSARAVRKIVSDNCLPYDSPFKDHAALKKKSHSAAALAAIIEDEQREEGLFDGV